MNAWLTIYNDKWYILIINSSKIVLLSYTYVSEYYMAYYNVKIYKLPI